jgi:dTDP-glucose pyrophosphorylase
MKDIILLPSDTIKTAFEVIDNGAIKLAIVVDENSKFLGTISDGDIRRAILKGKSLEDSIENVYNKKPFFVKESYDKYELIKSCKQNKIYQIPVVNDKNEVIDIVLLDELIETKEYPNKVILMVGGLGTRLRPLTNDMPKPMLKVGDKPILETIIDRFKKSGFKNFVFCVNYKAEIIKNYFGNGSKFGVNIEYVDENKRMGTAGALSLLKEKPKEAFFVMNGDLLTTLDFSYLLEYHHKNEAVATMAVREHKYQVPFGVVNLEGNKIRSIEEKPTFNFFVSAGIYVLEPETIDLIPKNEFFDMPDLFNKLIEAKKETVSFPIKEYWTDIGRIEEYKKANEEFGRVFK